MTFLYDKTEQGIMVQLHVGTPTDADWQGMLDFTVTHKSTLRGVLVFALGDGGPTAKQRSDLAEVIKTMPGLRAAIMTESRIIRGVLTAINWLTKRHDEARAFPLDGFNDALTFLGASDESRRSARALADKLGAFSKSRKAAS